MHDFSCTNAADMYYTTLADRVRFFKESKEGILIMCNAMEDMGKESLQEGVKEGIKEGAVNTAKRMLADGMLTLEKIAEYAGLPLDEVKKLKAEHTAGDFQSSEILFEIVKSEYQNEFNRTSVIDTKVGITLPIIATYFFLVLQFKR